LARLALVTYVCTHYRLPLHERIAAAREIEFFADVHGARNDAATLDAAAALVDQWIRQDEQ